MWKNTLGHDLQGVFVSEHWERCVPVWSLFVECAAVHLHSNRGKLEMEDLLKSP